MNAFFSIKPKQAEAVEKSGNSHKQIVLRSYNVYLSENCETNVMSNVAVEITKQIRFFNTK